MSEDPDEETIKRRSENADVAMTGAGCFGIEALGCVLPAIAVVLSPIWLLAD